MVRIEKLAEYPNGLDMICKYIYGHDGKVWARLETAPSMYLGYVRVGKEELWKVQYESGITELWVMAHASDSTRYCWKMERYRVVNMYRSVNRSGEMETFATLSQARIFAGQKGSVSILGDDGEYTHLCGGYIKEGR